MTILSGVKIPVVDLANDPAKQYLPVKHFGNASPVDFIPLEKTLCRWMLQMYY